MSRPLTFIIGLDGATFDLIEPLVQGGYLPTLARLMAQGIRGPLQAWPNMNSEAAWTSLATGCNPGQHGIYHLAPHARRGPAWRLATAADRKKDPFWRLLSAAGQRVGIINVPLSYPIDPVNGFMLSGMHTPSVRSPGFAYPPDLPEELQRQGIDYVIDVPNLADLCYRNPQRALQEAQRMVSARSRTILHLMRTRPWDLLMAVFHVTDIMQHFFWPDEAGVIENDDWTPMRRIYRQIDSFLSDALALIDQNTSVLLVSDHGFGRVHSGRQCLNQLLAQLGFLRYRQRGGQPRSQLLKSALLFGRKLIPYRLQDPLARIFPRLHGQAIHEARFSGVDWSHTQVFAGQHGGKVYINLERREAEGIVPIEDYDPLRERIRGILLNLTDPATGSHVIRAVHRREDVYHGPYVEQAADLLIEWDDSVLRDSLCYRVAGESITVQSPERPGRDKRVSGRHRPQGIFIAYGPHIKRGATVANACLYDIAPTVLCLQGHPIPADMDGKVLTDIFAEDHPRCRDVGALSASIERS